MGKPCHGITLHIYPDRDEIFHVKYVATFSILLHSIASYIAVKIHYECAFYISRSYRIVTLNPSSNQIFCDKPSKIVEYYNLLQK